MFVFKQQILNKVFEGEKGVDLVSYGKPRDAFQLSVDVPHWTSGYGGKYEMRHTHVPAGVMVAVGNLEDLDLSDQAKLKAQLKEIDIYPTGHSGDFAGQDIKTLTKWFTDRSRLDNEVNNQTPITHAKRLTPAGLGKERFDDLANYLAGNMNLFKDPQNGALVPGDHAQREEVLVDKDSGGEINLRLAEPAKILVERRYKNGEQDITPLDRAMLGRTWVTADGQPLGHRGEVDLSIIALKANQIEHVGQPVVPLPYMRAPGFESIGL